MITRLSGYIISTVLIVYVGPKDHTLVDFWRLVWQERPLTIVMVTNIKEGNKVKCQQYWPDSGSKHFGHFKVTLVEYQVFADYVIRTLQVTVRHTIITYTYKLIWSFYAVRRQFCKSSLETEAVSLHVLA